MKKIVSMIVVSVMAMSLCACTGKADQSASAGGSSVQQSEEFTEQLSTDSAAESEAESMEESATRIITDSTDRDVEIPSRVESIVCVGVGALRYSCYMDAAGLVVGVEDYEVKEGMSRLYNYVNFDKFKDLPVTGTNGEPNIEEIITAGPQVIVMSSYASADADDLQAKSGIPVVMVPGSDTTLDDNAYETIRIMGELYGKEDRAQELTAYLKGIQKDLDDRTADIPEEDKPSVYVAGVSFKGAHGFEGTEAYYGPFELIHANNLANTTDQTGRLILIWNRY